MALSFSTPPKMHSGDPAWIIVLIGSLARRWVRRLAGRPTYAGAPPRRLSRLPLFSARASQMASYSPACVDVARTATPMARRYFASRKAHRAPSGLFTTGQIPRSPDREVCIWRCWAVSSHRPPRKKIGPEHPDGKERNNRGAQKTNCVSEKNGPEHPDESEKKSGCSEDRLCIRTWIVPPRHSAESVPRDQHSLPWRFLPAPNALSFPSP